MREKRLIMSYLLLLVFLCSGAIVTSAKQQPMTNEVVDIAIPNTHISDSMKVYETLEEAKQVTTEKKETKKVKKKEFNLTDEEVKLIALVTMAEAEGECEKGKRLVIDTILNRVASKRFPNSVRKVIYQKNQFTSMWNGRVDQVKATKKVCKLVREEAEKRTNKKVMFFNSRRYGCGKALFKVGNHYFSSL